MDIKVGDRVRSGETYEGIVIHIIGDKAWVRWDRVLKSYNKDTSFDTVDDLEDLTKVAE